MLLQVTSWVFEELKEHFLVHPFLLVVQYLLFIEYLLLILRDILQQIVHYVNSLREIQVVLLDL